MARGREEGGNGLRWEGLNHWLDHHPGIKRIHPTDTGHYTCTPDRTTRLKHLVLASHHSAYRLATEQLAREFVNSVLH